MSITKKKIIKTLVVLALLGGIGFGVKSYFFAPPPPQRFLTTAVSKGDIENTVLATGTLEAFKLVSVGAQVSGQLKSLKVKLGDQVKKGDLIAEIEASTQQNTVRNSDAALDIARAQLAAKQASLKQAELNFTRQKEMLAADASSKLDFDAAEATLNMARAEIKSLKAQIEQENISADTAKVNLSYASIVAPMDGTVVAVVTEEGQTVNANQSAPTIIKLAQLDTMTVKAEISEADVPKVKTGQKAYFSILGEPDVRYNTVLRSIEPAPTSILSDTAASSSSTEAVYYNGLLDIENPDGKLRISMTAQVSIVLEAANDVLIIPATALGEKDKDGDYSVRVEDEQGRVSQRKIKTGISNNINIEVLDGLSLGEKVVIGEATIAEGDEFKSSSRMRRSPMGF
jgi:macrolide-specific efflux system membrane fusion protein